MSRFFLFTFRQLMQVAIKRFQLLIRMIIILVYLYFVKHCFFSKNSLFIFVILNSSKVKHATNARMDK